MAQISIFFITNLLLLFIVPTETRRFCRSSHFLPSWKKYINKISNQNLKPRFSNLRPYYPYNYQNLKGSSSSSIPESALQQNTNYISQETENEVKKTEASLKRLDDP